MHAVFISFQSAANEEELAEPFLQYANALRDGAIPGFCSKTWLGNEERVGGFHIFENREAADRYLNEMFTPNVATNPAFTSIRIERYEVDEAMSAITNGLPARASVPA
jgi:hypothetical protein